MYYHIKTLVIKHPFIPDKFVIGMQACVQIRGYLPNDRFILQHKLIIPQKVNPWGYKGETREVILDYFKNCQTLIDYNGYPYPYALDISPVVKPVKPILIIQGVNSKVNYVPLLFPEMIEDIERGLVSPVNLSNDEPFKVAGLTLTWKKLFETEYNLYGNEPVSASYLLRDEDLKLLEQPYYLIKHYGGDYFMNYNSKTSERKAAKQFSDEKKAFKYAFEHPESFEYGFEVEEVPPCDIPQVRIC